MEDLIKMIHEFELNYKGSIYIEFVPEIFEATLMGNSFETSSEFADFWNKELKVCHNETSGKYSVRKALKEDYKSCAKISMACDGQTRGFEGKDLLEVNKWCEEEFSDAFLLEDDNRTKGVLFTKLYGHNTEAGIVL